MKKRVLFAALAASLSLSTVPAVADEGDGFGLGGSFFSVTIDQLTCQEGAWLSFLCFDSGQTDFRLRSEGDGSGDKSEGDGSGDKSEGDGSGDKSEGDGSGDK